MSQSTVVLPVSGVVSGVTMATDMNAALDSLRTSFTGASAPSADTPTEGQLWLDTSFVGGGNLPILRQYDGSAWIAIGVLDTTAHLIHPNTGPLKTTAGTTTAYTLTTTPYEPTGTPTTGFEIRFKLNATNTGACTLAVNGGTAYPLRSSTGVDFASGQLLINSILKATWLGSEWLVNNVISSGATIATQAEMEAATSTSASVTPGRIKFNPTSPKCMWSGQIAITDVTGASSSINTTTDVVTWNTSHGLHTGQAVSNFQGASQIPDATAAYVRVISATQFKVYDTFADANADTNAFNFTSTTGQTTITMAAWTYVTRFSFGMDATTPVGPEGGAIANITDIGFNFHMSTALSATTAVYLITFNGANIYDSAGTPQSGWRPNLTIDAETTVMYELSGGGVFDFFTNFGNVISGNWGQQGADDIDAIEFVLWGDQ